MVVGLLEAFSFDSASGSSKKVSPGCNCPLQQRHHVSQTRFRSQKSGVVKDGEICPRISYSPAAKRCIFFVLLEVMFHLEPHFGFLEALGISYLFFASPTLLHMFNASPKELCNSACTSSSLAEATVA